MLSPAKRLIMMGEKKYKNLIPNGDVSKGTDGYFSNDNALSTENGYLISTSKGKLAYGRTFINGDAEIQSGRVYYCKIVLGVTDDVCINMKARILGSSGGTVLEIGVINNPVMDQLYALSKILTATNQTGYVQVYFQHEYETAEIAIGKVMKTDNIAVIDITDLPPEQQTEAWCIANIYPNIIW